MASCTSRINRSKPSRLSGCAVLRSPIAQDDISNRYIVSIGQQSDSWSALLAAQGSQIELTRAHLRQTRKTFRHDGTLRYRADTRVAAKQRRASSTADGPRKNRSPGVGEAKLARALRSMPTTSTQVPHRKMAAGNREPQYPALPRTTRAASMSTAAETALARRSADVSVAPPQAAPPNAIPRASSI